MKFFPKYIIALVLGISLLSSCRQTELYEKDTVIPGYKWRSDFPATGSFQITDTTALYNIYIVLRHTDAYAYNNIWLNVGLQAPGDSMQLQKLNLGLGTDAQGWEGVGMNDIREVRKLISAGPKRFRKPGEYRFSISQVMRDDPLEHVMNAGLRLEKLP